MQKIRAALIFLVLVLGTSCTSQQVYVNSAAIHSQARYAAVLPLVNLTSYPKAGLIVGDLLTTELRAMSNFAIMEQTAMLEKIRGGKELDETIDKAVAGKIGKELGVDTVIYGSVNEFRYKRGLDENPVVGITVRMLDLQTGKIVWSGSRSATGGCFWFCEDSLSMLAQDVCHDMVTVMLKRPASKLTE